MITFEFTEQELDILEYGLGFTAIRLEEDTLKPQDIKNATYQNIVDLYGKIVKSRGQKVVLKDVK
jgi:hypothetical protein